MKYFKSYKYIVDGLEIISFPYIKAIIYNRFQKHISNFKDLKQFKYSNIIHILNNLYDYGHIIFP